MSAAKFLHLLLVTLALAGYGAYLRAAREPRLAPAAVSPGAIALIRAAEAEQLWRHDGTLFVDVRSAPQYAVGHIAGAVSLPEEDFEQRFPALRPRLERAHAIVVYCKSEDCGKSLWAAIRLRNLGLTQTRIYPAGWYDWQRHGLPHTGGS
jgi:rhodanese-related sulfurtransferase